MQHDAANATRDAVDVSAAGVIGGARRGAASALDPELAELWAVHPEQYEIFGEIARGGMGRILEARDVRHARFIAIKMLLGDSPEAARRFAREARITARLQHPAIVTLYESGRWPSGEPYLALKLIVGRPLRDAVAETRTLIARLELLPHLIAVAEAIAYAHGEGVVHRDLKPSNVLIGAFGETVVIDWGLARERDEPDDGAPTVPSSDFVVRSSAGARARTHDLTVAGSAIGTPCYMAPEQARGERVEASADVYSLGAMLYHVFSGAPPYAEAPPGNALARVLEGPPRPLSELAPDLPRELATIVDKAMAREPADRYATADELARDLKRYAAGQRVAVHSYSFAALARRWAARHRITLGVAASLLLALAVVGVSSVRRIARERDRAETARASADAARTAAENQRAAATLQRDAAARLVDFMLVDLRSRLEPIGKLDVLATVAGEVEGYYESVSSSAPDAPTMWRRGTALASIGRVDEARGDGAAARRKYEAAVALAAHALALESANEPARALVAEAHALLAALDVEEGKLDDAVREREGARAAARALVLAHPDDVRWRMLSVTGPL